VRFDPFVLLILPVILFSVVVHECAHGLAALRLGDATARERGRLTLNPLVHLDPIGSVVLPAVLWLAHAPFLLAWAKPIPIDRARLRHPPGDTVKVAMAGPLSNFLLALVCAALVRLATGPTAPDTAVGPTVLATIGAIALVGVVWNVCLGLFNLIPIPPLDGSWLIMRFMKLRHILLLHQFRLVGLILIVAILSSPLAKSLFAVPVRAVVGLCLGLFGVSMHGVEL